MARSVVQSLTGPNALLLAAVVLLLSALLLTQSRAAVASFVVGVLALSIMLSRGRDLSVAEASGRRAIVALLVAVLGLSIALSADPLLNRVGAYGLNDTTRTSIAMSAIKAVQSAPLQGHGFGGFEHYYPFFSDGTVAGTVDEAARRDAVLEVSGLHAGYGHVPVLHGISLTLHEGEAIGIVGHNGMGKSTLLKCMMGLLPARGGRIALDGTDVTRAPAHARSRLGMGYVPQGRGILPGLTALENLRLAWSADTGETEQQSLERVLELFPRLRRLLDRKGGALSGGGHVSRVSRGLHAPRRLVGLPRGGAGDVPRGDRAGGAVPTSSPAPCAPLSTPDWG
jgi:ABC-type multidrug transport system fused ATPase/permease subunit